MAGRNNGYNYDQDMFDGRKENIFLRIWHWIWGHAAWIAIGAVLFALICAFFMGVDMSGMFDTYSGAWIVVAIVAIIVIGLVIYGSTNRNRNDRY